MQNKILQVKIFLSARPPLTHGSTEPKSLPPKQILGIISFNPSLNNLVLFEVECSRTSQSGVIKYSKYTNKVTGLLQIFQNKIIRNHYQEPLCRSCKQVTGWSQIIFILKSVSTGFHCKTLDLFVHSFVQAPFMYSFLMKIHLFSTYKINILIVFLLLKNKII